MRHNVARHARRIRAVCSLQDDPEALRDFGFAIRTNNLKLSCSQLVVDIVGRAMLICGIAGLPQRLQVHARPPPARRQGAGLMVNNDRILGQNATMQIGLREG